MSLNLYCNSNINKILRPFGCSRKVELEGNKRALPDGKGNGFCDNMEL